MKLVLVLLCLAGFFVTVCAGGEGGEGALVTEKVYLDLEVEGQLAGRIVIGLFGSTSPKTVRNFVGLANHEVLMVIKYYYLHYSLFTLHV
jgi:hypothetical protein